VIILVKLSIAGASTTLFSLYSNLDYNTAIASGITKSQLEQQGYLLFDVPNNATTIRVVNTGVCDNFIDITINKVTSSTSSSTTSTTTIPITSTSSTSTSTSSTSTTTILDCQLIGNAVSI
jgi:hypothetical protein